MKMKKLLMLVLALSLAFVPVSFAYYTTDGFDIADDGASVVIEGSTVDANEMTLSFADPASDVTVTVPATTGTLTISGAADVADSVTLGASTVVFEGATADAFETTVTVTDPTADVTYTLPDGTGTAHVAIDTGGATSGNVLLETEIDASSELAALIDDETGTGLVVLGTNPVISGWAAESGANTACTSTCTTGTAILGFDSGSNVFVDESDATADTCICSIDN